MATIGGRVTYIRHTRELSHVKVGEETLVLKPAVMGRAEYEEWKRTARLGDQVTVKGDRIKNPQRELIISAHHWQVTQRAENASPATPQRSTVLGSAEKKGNTVNLSVQDAITTFGVDIDPHLERDFEIPVLDTLQRQGDVIVIPTPKKKLPAKAKAVEAAGVPVVRGENGGNTHLLLASGSVQFAPIDSTTSGQLDVGVFTVAEGATAFLAHPEHGYMGIAPGTYTVRRQREQADEIRQVAD